MYTGEYENLEIEGPTNIDNKKEKKVCRVPPGLEPRTSCVISECFNHSTTGSTFFRGKRGKSRHSSRLCYLALWFTEQRWHRYEGWVMRDEGGEKKGSNDEIRERQGTVVCFGDWCLPSWLYSIKNVLMVIRTMHCVFLFVNYNLN